MGPLQKFKWFPHTLNRLCALSPNVLRQKMLRKAKWSGVDTIRRWKSYLGSTYLANEKKEVLRAADQTCKHIFDLLGSGPVKVYYGMKTKGFERYCYNTQISSNGLPTIHRSIFTIHDYEPIDWHIDFKSGYRWNPKTYYKNIKYGHRLGVDVKVPWELSRFQHLTSLGEAYYLSKNEKYVKEFVNQVSDWIEHNPPKFGVNWKCTMDVAIRACNWLLAWEFFKDSPLISNEFIIKFFKSLLQHGRHIKNNLEYSDTLTSNVIINDKNFKEDNFIEVGNEIFSEEYIQRLYKMFEFVLYALKPNGKMPQIGDNDNGRFYIFTKREILDMRYLLTLGAIFFKESKFKIKEFGFCEEALWVFGEKGYKIWQGLEENSLTNIGSKAFPDAGWYIMRNDKDYMIVSCGPNGQNGNGGHCHNDKLSFELCIDGEDIIVDPGTYIYTAEPRWRNKFRSTAYHNTIVVDEKEQNRFDQKNLFWMGSQAQIKVNKWEISAEYDFLDAQHSGYRRLKKPIIHRRLIFFDKQKKYWIVKDIMTGKGFYQFNLYFHLPPSTVKLDEEFSLVVKTNLEAANLAITPLLTKKVSTSIEERWVSYQYGIKVKAPIIRYSMKSYTPTSFYNVIYPYKKGIDMKEVLSKVQKSKIQKLALSDSAHL